VARGSHRAIVRVVDRKEQDIQLAVGIVSVLAYCWYFWKAGLYASFGLNLFTSFHAVCMEGGIGRNADRTRNDDSPQFDGSVPVSICVARDHGSIYSRDRLAYSTLYERPIPYADALATGMSIVAHGCRQRTGRRSGELLADLETQPLIENRSATRFRVCIRAYGVRLASELGAEFVPDRSAA